MPMYIFYMIIISIVVIAIALVELNMLSWILPHLFYKGAPYVASKPETVEAMISLAEIQPTDRIVDLGSGDGRIVIAAARAGALKSVGYEIDPRLIKRSKKNALDAQVVDKTEFRRQSMWKVDLSEVDTVFLYQITYAMKGLSKKLRSELPSGAKVISSGFIFPDWEPVKKENGISLYIV
jgi:ribosomal protein L11 methylase PrmA